MKTRRSVPSTGTSAGRPKKRQRRSLVSIKLDQGSVEIDPEGPFFAWSPVRIIRIIES